MKASRRSIAVGPVLAVAMILAGCSDQSANSPAPTDYAAAKSDSAYAPRAMMVGMASIAPPPAPTEEAQLPAPNTAKAGRKIIYDATIALVTEDLNKLESTLLRLVNTANAYIADSDRTGSAGTTRQGTWKVRVPVEGYDTFLRAAVGLGELVSVKANSQDVSEEFFDLEARETAKKVEEARLLKHLTESTGKLEEILAVERELSRVRSEIERMQGRLRVLANLTSLATITITANEVKDYVPPQAPTLSTRVSRTFQSSLERLSLFGEAILMGVVSITPWLPILLIVALVLWLLIRRIIASVRRMTTGSTPL